MRIHNRYLSEGAHRLANGALGAVFTLGVGAVLWQKGPGPHWRELGHWLTLLSAPAGVALAFIPPSRFTLVEGIAGEAGYDELDSPESNATEARPRPEEDADR